MDAGVAPASKFAAVGEQPQWPEQAKQEGEEEIDQENQKLTVNLVGGSGKHVEVGGGRNHPRRPAAGVGEDGTGRPNSSDSSIPSTHGSPRREKEGRRSLGAPHRGSGWPATGFAGGPGS